MANSKKELILAIDPSMRHIGISISTLKHVIFSDCLIYNKKLKGAHLLREIYEDTQNLLKTYKPTLVAIEGYAYLSVGRVYQLGEVGGVLRLACAMNKIPVIVIPPSRIKKFAGKGNASKEFMVNYVKQNLTKNDKVDIQQMEKYNDVADAVILSKLVSHGIRYLYGGGIPKNRKAAEVIVQIKHELETILEGPHA